MQDAFTKFIDRIGFYKTTIYQVDTHLKEFIKSRKANLPKSLSKDFVMPILGAKLVYRNVLTTKHEFAFTRLVDVENVEEKTQEIIESYCNFCVSQSFEAFESFLKDILVSYLISDKTFIDENARLQDLDTSRFETCRADIYKLLRNNNRYNKQLFNWLYKIDADLKKHEQTNFLRFDFIEWNVVLTEVRHSIVHSNSILSKDKIRNWTDFQMRLLKRLFTGSETEQEITLSAYENYDYIIKIVAQHGQLIFDRIKAVYNKNIVASGT
ncbi:MAG TPA: hypothetical protein VLC98_11630 [Phnomibacter sp.]|nr:hypothetical protein [Phnomibacter sp.]